MRFAERGHVPVPLSEKSSRSFWANVRANPTLRERAYPQRKVAGPEQHVRMVSRATLLSAYAAAQYVRLALFATGAYPSPVGVDCRSVSLSAAVAREGHRGKRCAAGKQVHRCAALRCAVLCCAVLCCATDGSALRRLRSCGWQARTRATRNTKNGAQRSRRSMQRIMQRTPHNESTRLHDHYAADRAPYALNGSARFVCTHSPLRAERVAVVRT
jgi:hypothetical protein